MSHRWHLHSHAEGPYVKQSRALFNPNATQPVERLFNAANANANASKPYGASWKLTAAQEQLKLSSELLVSVSAESY